MNPVMGVAKAISLAPQLQVFCFQMRRIQPGDSYVCAYCDRTIKYDHHRNRPTRDHFIPKSKLLKGQKTKFVVCCQWCNSRKSDKVFSSIEEARTYIASCKPPKILPNLVF